MSDAAPLSLRSMDAQRSKSGRELGASLVLAIHRLLKVAQIHALDNMAVLQQLDQTTEALRIFCTRVQGPATFLFAKNTVFVSGQLLKASRTEYEAALELGATLASVGATELSIQPEVDNDDLRQLAESVVTALRDRSRGIARQPSPRVRLRRVDAAALLADEEELPNDEQIVRTYAQAIVVMRRVIETLADGRWELPHEAKRIAQKLVMLSEGDTPSFLGVTAMRNANHDAAGRAVNASILAVSMCRLLTDDLGMLARIAMAALLHDVGRPLVVGPARARGNVRLSEDEERRLPAAVAFVHTLLGGFRLPSMMRTVVDFEAQWHARCALLGPLYGGERGASIAARIVATAHRFNALLTPDPASRVLLSPDDAVAVIRKDAQDAEDRVVVTLLVGAIGLFPTGTVVELSSGERGVVVRSPDHPLEYVRPVVRIVYLANRSIADPPFDLDLREDPARVVTRVETAVDERLRSVRGQILEAAPRPSLPRSALRRSARPEPEPPTEEAPATQPSDVEPQPSSRRREPPPLPSRREVREVMDSVPPTPRVSVKESPPPSAGAPPTSRRVPWAALLVDSSPPPSSICAGTVPSPPPRRDSEPPSSQVSGVRPAGIPQTLPSMPAVRPPPPSTPPPPPSLSEPPSSVERTPSSISAVFSLITKNVTATARGTLAKTPLAHLFVYVLDRALTGTLVLTPPEETGIQHGVYFERGAAVRVWTPAGVAPLGRMLVETGQLPEAALADVGLSIVADHEPALEAELLRNGSATREQIALARAEQIRRGGELLFTLSRATEYAFFADTDLVEGHVGSIAGYVPPLELLTRGLRKLGEDSVMTRVLERLGTQPLRLTAGLRDDAFGFDLDEAAAFGAIALSAPTLADLDKNPLLDPVAARRVVYVLLLTRSLELAGSPSQRTPIGNPSSSR